MRPKTWIASISPVALGIVIALQEGIFHPLLFLFTLLTALGIQITTNLSNDYFDYLKGADTAARKGSVRVMQAGLVTAQKMRAAILISSFFTLCLGGILIYRGGLVIALLTLLSLILALLYTAGPFSLAYLGLGELFVLLFFGPVAVCATNYLQTLHFSWQAAVVGLSCSLISTAILIANNLRDHDEDKRANKKTLVVRFGRLFGKIEYSSALLAAPLPLLLYTKERPFLWLTTLISLPAFPLVLSLFKREEYDRVFKQTGKILWLFTFLTCLGWML
jgi:1,4-dihydroxy-2-naphthoate octaprenyltransferase